MDISDRIKLLRKEHLGLSQEKFGQILGVKRDVINNIENNRLKNPEQKEPLYRLICSKFEVSEDWLRTGQGEMQVELTDSQKVMKYTAMLLKDTDSVIASAIKAFIVTYEQLDDAGKETIDNIAVQYLDNLKKSK